MAVVAIKITCIYCLYDPRDPQQIPMYVGKGNKNRAKGHWSKFLRREIAVNGLLRRWFEKLKLENIEPAWKFLEENVIDWQKAEQNWISCMRVVNPNLCNVADGGNAWPLQIFHRFEDLSKAGKIGGGVRFKQLWKSDPDKMKEFSMKGAQKGGNNSFKADLTRARKSGCIGGTHTKKLYPELAAKSGKIGGTISGHNRWHVSRGIINPGCKLCCQS